MNPYLYLYKENNDTYQIYLGGVSTLQGLSFFAEENVLSVVEFGATLYKQYGWASEKEIPSLKTIKDTISFLTTEDDIGLIDFKAEILGIGTISSHDDGECNFNLIKKQECLNILRTTIPQQHRDMLINKLLNNQGCYFSLSDSGIVQQYRTFDEYLRK